MIEIVCPSCQARYQLPEGSIGPDGRKVSCSSCAHKWRAFPEGMEPAAGEAALEPVEAAPEVVAPPPPPSAMAPSDAAAVVTPQAPPEPTPISEAAAMAAVASAAVAPTGSETAAPSPVPSPASGDREEQMAAIRQMLSDLKEGVEEAPEPEMAPPPQADAPAPTMRVNKEEEEELDPLKSRIDNLSNTAKAAKGQSGQSGYDAARMRKLHEKRAKKLQKSRERKKRSGGFITGFTLVGVVTATMVGLYVMHPQIIEAQPKMAPAMNEYVVTVDRYRVELNEKTTEWKAWLTERIGGLAKDEEAEG
jgi:predicted Zn finger-like uncharacterized protein